jgi:hypothetical protein
MTDLHLAGGPAALGLAALLLAGCATSASNGGAALE